jgi:hypothetical protein
MKLRNVFFLALAGLVASASASAAGQEAPAKTDGLACFENLAAPEFPAAALHAHVDGSVWTWTQVNAQGVPGKTDTQVVSAWSEGAKLLTPPVEKAIHAAKIKPECAGKKVWVVFRYALHGDATANPKPTSRTDGPNVMWIESPPAARSESAAVKH